MSAGTTLTAGSTVTAGTGIIVTTGGLTVTAGGLTVTDGDVTISSGTASTTTSTGALKVGGGVGITGATNIGGALSVTGTITGTLATVSQPNITTIGSLVGGTVPVARISGTLPATNGGTGQSTYVVGDLLYCSTADTLTKLAKPTAATSFLQMTTGGAPSWVSPPGSGVRTLMFTTDSIADPVSANRTLTWDDIVITFTSQSVFYINQYLYIHKDFIINKGKWMVSWYKRSGSGLVNLHETTPAGGRYIASANTAYNLGWNGTADFYVVFEFLFSRMD